MAQEPLKLRPQASKPLAALLLRYLLGPLLFCFYALLQSLVFLALFSVHFFLCHVLSHLLSLGVILIDDPTDRVLFATANRHIQIHSRMRFDPHIPIFSRASKQNHRQKYQEYFHSVG